MTSIPITEDRIAKLREFGLSEYAARAYLALLDLGTAEARAISTLSKVPTSKIYHVLEQLHERGLVEILPEFPKRYGPVPFEAFLEKVLHGHQRAVSSLEEDWGSLVDMFSLKGDVEIERRGSFAIVRGRRNVLLELGALVGASAREVILFGTEGMGHRAKLLQGEFRQARARGAAVRLVSPVTPGNVEALQAVSGLVEVRERHPGDRRQGAGICIAVVDDARAFIAHFLPDDDNVTRGEDTAITTDDPGMVLALRSLLDDSWRHATPFPGAQGALVAPTGAAAARSLTAPIEGATAMEAFLACATGHVLLAGTATDLEAWTSSSAWRDAVARGVRFRLVTEAGATVGPEAEARRSPRVALRAAVADGREALFAVPSTPEGAAEAWFHTTDVLHLATLSGAIETAWQAAEGPVRAMGAPASPGVSR